MAALGSSRQKRRLLFYSSSSTYAPGRILAQADRPQRIDEAVQSAPPQRLVRELQVQQGFDRGGGHGPRTHALRVKEVKEPGKGHDLVVCIVHHLVGCWMLDGEDRSGGRGGPSTYAVRVGGVCAD